MINYWEYLEYLYKTFKTFSGRFSLLLLFFYVSTLKASSFHYYRCSFPHKRATLDPVVLTLISV